MNASLVSIIVPCYNQAHYLRESLQSVIDQTYEKWECIIVNDGSPDDTSLIADNWIKKDDRFSLIEKVNGGLSSARNAGIKIASGEFILPLDADDLLAPDYLKRVVPVLEQNTDIAIVSCYSHFFKGNKDNTIHQLQPKGDNYKFLLYVNQLVATSLYRKSCWQAVGGYDEQMKNGFEDWDFWLSITKSGWRYTIIPEYLFYYRKADQSMLTDTISHHAETVKEYLMHKHREIYIADFDNCIRVFTHDLKASRAKANSLQVSIEYRIGKLFMKPYRLFQQLFSNNHPSA